MKFIIIIATLAACNFASNRQIANHEIPSGDHDIKLRRINKTGVFFSSLMKRDTFKLELTGEYLTKGKIRFTIITSQNEFILDEKFNVMDLYGWGPDVTKPNPDSLTIERYLIKRFESFFDSEHFYKPAIGEKEKYDQLRNGVISESDWREIQGSPNSIGFGFTLGEEAISYIVYFKKERKAIVYKTCC